MNEQDKFLAINNKQIRYINCFWLGFIIYTLSVTIYAVNIIDLKIIQALQIPGLLLMIPAAIQLIKFKFENKYLQVVYFFYCVWLLITIFRGFDSVSDYSYFKVFLFNAGYGGMPYFLPLILLFPNNLVFYKKVFDTILFFGISYIVYDAIFIKYLLNPDRSSLMSQGVVENFSDLSFACGFLLLTFYYHSKRTQILAVGIVGISLLFAIIRARRGLIFMTGDMILFSYILYLRNSKKKLLIIYLTAFIALCGIVYANGIYKLQDNKIFGFVADRGDEDTRSGVEFYYYADMNTIDWIIGRGINGEYYCPSIDEERATNYRDVIETGYLQIILKGGILSLGLLVLIAIPALIKGIFYSKNTLSKAAGIWILLSVINSYPTVVNTFSMNYFLVWISIGICYSNYIRNLPEETLRNFFQPAK